MFSNHLLFQVVEHPHPQQHPEVGEERFQCLDMEAKRHSELQLIGLHSLVALVLEVLAVAVVQ